MSLLNKLCQALALRGIKVAKSDRVLANRECLLCTTKDKCVMCQVVRRTLKRNKGIKGDDFVEVKESFLDIV